MKIQTLISTMYLDNANELKSNMNICGDCLIINQCDTNITETKRWGNCCLINTNERGLSKSRNMALMNCTSDIALIADDDIEYDDDYLRTIEDGFKKYPDADIIAFYLDSNDEKNKKKKLKPGRIRGIDYFKIASWQLAIKKKEIQEKGVKFDEDFGAGSRYYMGEENIFLSDAKRKGLKIYSHPVKIGTVCEKRESTWFKEYNNDYFINRGAGYFRMSRVLFPLYIIQFAVRKSRLYKRNMGMLSATKAMFSGALEYKQLMKHGKIDFVVLWVDDSDVEWRRKRTKTARENGMIGDNGVARFRDWDLFKYWFRGVERNAPWVNNVYLVTEGHLPKWLNKNNPKLKVVKHEDFIPKNALPTFNTNTIELCLNNIKGLSEQFVLFNDDLFLINKTKPTDFYKKGKPVNTMSLCPIYPGDKIYKIVYNNMEIINRHFDYGVFKKNNKWKILSIKQGKHLLWSIPGLFHKKFFGFANYHMPNSYKKSIIDEIWKEEKQCLLETIKTPFRDYDNNVSDWLFNYWQFAKGDYVQRPSSFGINTYINDAKVPNIITRKKVKCICLNDLDNIADVKKVQNEVSSSFERILPEKSGYEK